MSERKAPQAIPGQKSNSAKPQPKATVERRAADEKARQGKGAHAEKDAEAAESERKSTDGRDKVDEASWESFPASDAPAY